MVHLPAILPHHVLEPGGAVNCKGVFHWQLDADKYENDPALDKIRADRGYSYQVLNLNLAWDTNGRIMS